MFDLRDFQVPLLTSSVHPKTARKQYDSPEVNAWSRALFDAVVKAAG